MAPGFEAAHEHGDIKLKCNGDELVSIDSTKAIKMRSKVLAPKKAANALIADIYTKRKKPAGRFRY